MQMLLMQKCDVRENESTNVKEEEVFFLSERIISSYFRPILISDKKNLSLKSHKSNALTPKHKKFQTEREFNYIKPFKFRNCANEKPDVELSNLISKTPEGLCCINEWNSPLISPKSDYKRIYENYEEIENKGFLSLINSTSSSHCKLLKTLRARRQRKAFRRNSLSERIVHHKKYPKQVNHLIGTVRNTSSTSIFCEGGASYADETIHPSNKSRKLFLENQTGVLEQQKCCEDICNNKYTRFILKSNRKRITDPSLGISLNTLKDKHNKFEAMSVYDSRMQCEERSVGNGYVTRGLHSGDNSPILNNHCFHNPQQMIATLCNIGNTCYLNSVIYTLRFAPLFLHNLHHLVEDLSHINQKMGNRMKSSSLGRNVGGLNSESLRSWSSKDLVSLESSNFDLPKSSQQMATEKLHELYQNLHKNELVESTEPFHADTFLRAIQDVSAIFEGNQQQDAHEFLMCVLDSIRETCQTMIKSISEYPDLLANGFAEQSESVQPCKDRDRERETSIIKTSFFSRRSKRKEDAKHLKELRFRSPHKEDYATTNSHVEPLNSATNSKSFNTISRTNEEIMTNDKERLQEKIKQLGLDFFTEDFEGITVSTTKCLSCETVTEQKETMIDIAVPISGYENMDTGEKSHSFIQNSCITREYFRGENKYRCEQCIGYTEAIRSISYEVLPRLLVIQLSRFSGGMEKINSYLPTPFTLQCFCIKCCEQPDNKKHHVYKLYSVITHVGATMSVGHYIAYTCSLDWDNDYINCPKDRKHQVELNSLNSLRSNSNISNAFNSSVNHSTINTSDKNVGLMKKMRFGRTKASSSNDMSKQAKGGNGVTNKNIANGVEKLNISTTCQGWNCCSLRVKNSVLNNSNSINGSNSANTANIHNGIFINLKDDISHSSMFNSASCYSDTINYGSNIKSKSATNSQIMWYMCDDDKIKAMSQREFEELLSPNRKIMVTPYLLFYARQNLK